MQWINMPDNLRVANDTQKDLVAMLGNRPVPVIV